MKLILIILLQISSVYAIESCENLLDDCEYYTCINKEKMCGKRSYFVGFGRKYCNKFSKIEHKFSNAGQSWIEETKKCLIRNIDNIDESSSCKEYKREAVSQHVPCYIESGYCQLSKKDKLRVTKTVIATMWRPTLLSAALKVLSSCRKLK